MGTLFSLASRSGPAATRGRRHFMARAAVGVATASLWLTGCDDGTGSDPPSLEVAREPWAPGPSPGASFSLDDFHAMARALGQSVVWAVSSSWVYDSLENWALSASPMGPPTANCSVSGTQRVEWTDVDHNGRLSEGDILQMDLRTCKSGQDPRGVDASWSMRVNRMMQSGLAHVALLDASGALLAFSVAGTSFEGGTYRLQVTDDWGSTQRSCIALRGCVMGTSNGIRSGIFDADVVTVSSLTGRHQQVGGRLNLGSMHLGLSGDNSDPLVLASNASPPGSFVQPISDFMPSSGRLMLTDASGHRVELQIDGGKVNTFFYAAGSPQPLAQWRDLSWDTLLAA